MRLVISAIARSTSFAWQAWQLDLPPEWDPVRLEGDFDAGYVLLADLNRPRMGVRWVKVRGDARDAVNAALRDEVGQLAADEAVAIGPPGGGGGGGGGAGEWSACTVYIEPEPPGRDVFVGVSGASGRLVQIVAHVGESPARDRAARDAVLASLTDAPADGERPWAVFGLSCRVPREFRLRSHQLLAGDLCLTFDRAGGRRGELLVREIAVAELALKRRTLRQWLERQCLARRRYYRPAGTEPEQLALADSSGESPISGLRTVLRRRRRFFFMRNLPRELTACALHDAARDRLVMLMGDDADVLAQVAGSIGWAGGTGSERVRAQA